MTGDPSQGGGNEDRPGQPLVWGKPDAVDGALPAESPPLVFGTPGVESSSPPPPLPPPTDVPAAVRPERPEAAAAPTQQPARRQQRRPQPHWERRKGNPPMASLLALAVFAGIGYGIYAAVKHLANEVSDAIEVNIPSFVIPTAEVGELTPEEQAACHYGIDSIVIPGSLTITAQRICGDLASQRLGGGTMTATAHYSRLGSSYRDVTCRGSFAGHFALCAMRTPAVGKGKIVEVTVDVPSGPVKLSVVTEN